MNYHPFFSHFIYEENGFKYIQVEILYDVKENKCISNIIKLLVNQKNKEVDISSLKLKKKSKNLYCYKKKVSAMIDP